MNSRRVRLLLALSAVSAIRGFSQEITLEELRVEAQFDVRLSLPDDFAVRILLERLDARAETRRDVKLRKANQGAVTNLVDLLQAPPGIPVGLSSSGKPLDDFFQQNYMRADLNPRASSSLFSPK